MRHAAFGSIVFLAACGGDSLDGTFTGTWQGQPVVLTLSEDDERLSGTIRWNGVESSVSGAIDGDRLKGRVPAPQLGIELPFVATLKGDTIDWTYELAAQLGQDINFSLTRDGSASAREGKERPSLDPQLVGRWYSDVGGTGASGNTVTTRLRCALNGDGTFEYGGAESVITIREDFFGPGSTGGAGPASLTRGEWKTEGGVLFTRSAGGPWTALGRYSVSGSDLLLYAADGGKNLWSRE